MHASVLKTSPLIVVHPARLVLRRLGGVAPLLGLAIVCIGCGESASSESTPSDTTNQNVSPGDETPGGNTPANETPAGNTPASECPDFWGARVNVSATVLFAPENRETDYLDYLRLDSTHAYWINNFDTYYRVPLDAGPLETLVQLEGEGALWTDTVLYGDDLLFRHGEDLRLVPKSGGAAEVFTTVSDFVTGSTLRTMVVDGSTLYAVSSAGGIGCSASSPLFAISLEDGSVETLTEELSCPDDIAMDADSIYVSLAGPLDSDDYKHHEPMVVRVPKSGGTPVVLETGTRVTRLRTDGGGYVFGLVGGQEEAGTALVRIPKAGGAVETLVGADCDFDSDLLELVDGTLFFSWGEDLVMMTPDGELLQSLHDDEHNLSASHEAIAMQGDLVCLLDNRDLVTFTLP